MLLLANMDLGYTDRELMNIKDPKSIAKSVTTRKIRQQMSIFANLRIWEWFGTYFDISK